ncbi:lactate permease [Sporodiniella umbellata]|nr:lactate permease [Sporodiniella umbellata]
MAFGVLPPESIAKDVFIQPLKPIGNSLIGSFFVGLIPLILLLVLLGVFNIPAYYASFAGLVVCIIISVFGWQMPAVQAFEAVGNGFVYANWPIMWLVFNAMLIYNISVNSKLFDYFQRWILIYTPPDKRIILLIIGFAFGALLEGVAGFGVPGAICSSILVSLGFEASDALVYTLIFNTTPVAFGALGTPVSTLATLTELPVLSLSAMMGRQLPFLSLFLPAYSLVFFAGIQAGIVECWPVALVAGISFALPQAIFANFVGPELPDLMAGLISLLSILIFVQYWKPPYRPEYEATIRCDTTGGEIGLSEEKITLDKSNDTLTRKEALLAWCPWIIIVLVVIIWTFAKASLQGAIRVFWPHLHREVWLTLYGKLYDAVWTFQPLATGTALLISCIIYSIIVWYHGACLKVFLDSIKDTALQLYKPTITVNFIMAFAYLFNYSGIVYTIGYQLSSVGKAFPFLSAWLGWIACFLSGSDTSANSLFGNLQVVTARQIGLSTILMASTNSSGAITSKMISPQNLITGVSIIGLQGKEGVILRQTILHSLLMCTAIGIMACVQQYLMPGIIPPS